MKTDSLAMHGVEVSHHFGGGAYAKETVIPPGIVLHKHVHPHEHLSILAVGRVEVDIGGEKQVIEAPACLTIAGGVHHSVTALLPSVWYCIHATTDTNPETVDSTVLLHD